MSKVDVEKAYEEYLEGFGAISHWEDYADEKLYFCKGCSEWFDQPGDINADDDCEECAKIKDNQEAAAEDADREMFGDEAEYLPDNMGNK